MTDELHDYLIELASFLSGHGLTKAASELLDYLTALNCVESV